MLEVSKEFLSDLDEAMNWQEAEELEPIKEFSGYDIYEAIATRSLTVDHLMYLHEMGINWQIDVRKR